MIRFNCQCFNSNTSLISKIDERGVNCETFYPVQIYTLNKNKKLQYIRWQHWLTVAVRAASDKIKMKESTVLFPKINNNCMETLDGQIFSG